MNEEEIFHQALQCQVPVERAAYLEEVCADKPALRASVEALLRANEGASGFLEYPDPVLGAREPEQLVSEHPGTVIGPYKLLEQIGEGGFGVVFLAEQSQPVRRKVALKVLKPGMDSRQVIARFEAERQALAIMDHPNIAKVHDGGATPSGRPYFVMELVKGVPITEFCDQNHLTPRQRLELFIPVCQAVQHAHLKRIIHRDLKPSNVLVTRYDVTPVVKVIDFGVAKALGQELTDTALSTGFAQIIGTPLYMSPEQAGQSGLDIDTRSDIYSLGVLLYELLTGTPPFTRERFEQAAYDEIRRIIREEEPPKPSTRLSTTQELVSIAANRGLEPKKLSTLVRGELDWIVMKCLEKDRDRRYETANGLATDLQRYLRDEPVQACPPSAWYRFRKFARRNKGVLVAGGLVAAALLAGTVVSSYFAVQASHRASEFETARNLAASGEKQARQDQVRALEAEHTALLREADALVGRAHAMRLSRRPGQRFAAVDALVKAAAIGRDLGRPTEWFNRLRNEAIAALALPDIHITKVFGSFPPGSVGVELSDDFEYYARTTNTGGCTIRRVADDTEIAHLPELGEPAEAWFGVGRILALYGKSSHRFWLWDLSGAEPVVRFEERGTNLVNFRYDGRLLALQHVDGSISVYETASGKRLHRLTPGPVVPQDWGVVLHPTEPFLVWSSFYCHDVQVRDLRSGAVVASANPPWPEGSAARWSPDGRTLFLPDLSNTNKSGLIQEYAFDAKAPALRLLRTIQGPEIGGASLRFNPAGDRFVRRGLDEIVHLFDAVSGQHLFQTDALPGASVHWNLRFDNTGQRLAAALVGDRQDQIGLWSVADGREYRSVVHPGRGEKHAGVAVHPDGRLAVIGLTDGVALFDLKNGRELAHLPISAKACSAIFEQTGSLLTNGFEGFFRWPVRPDPANPGRTLVGPPARLPFFPGHRGLAASSDGRVIAQGMWNGSGMAAHAGGWILHPSSPTPRCVDAGQSVGSCSVSPDGRWVAFGLDRVKVYRAADGECVWQSPAGKGTYGRFSPDGRWLVTNVEGGRLYTVGTWEAGPQLGPGTPWDVTSDFAILGQINGIYRLVELATGRELARLEDPEHNTGPAAFTPDGTKLVVAARNGLRVWDLGCIRAELARLDLDWDKPPYSLAEEKPDQPALDVTVDLGALAPKGVKPGSEKK